MKIEDSKLLIDRDDWNKLVKAHNELVERVEKLEERDLSFKVMLDE